MAVIGVPGVAESDGEVFKLLPARIYPATIVAVEQKAVKNESSKVYGLSYLNFSYKAEDPDSGIAATVFDMIMLPVNMEGEDVGIMEAEDQRKCNAKLKVMQIALGLEDMGDSIDTDRFLHQDCQIEVGQRPAKGDFPASNTVKNILPA